MDVQRQDEQLEHTYSSSVPIRDIALRTCRNQWTIGKGGERGSGISVLIARHHDDDDDLGNRGNMFVFLFVFFFCFFCFCFFFVFFSTSLSRKDNLWSGTSLTHQLRKNFWVQDSVNKDMLTVFWDMKVLITINILENRSTANCASHCQLQMFTLFIESSLYIYIYIYIYICIYIYIYIK